MTDTPSQVRHRLRSAASVITAASLLALHSTMLFASDERPRAEPAASSVTAGADGARPTEGIITIAAGDPAAAASGVVLDSQADPQPLHAGAFEYSDAYQLRRKIHKVSSFATLPLFATELALGQSMYNTAPGDASSLRGLHAAVGAGIVGLFGVNTVTGAWNLFGEGWHDPNGRTLRIVHGLLMMAADAGFVATTATGPNSRSPRQALTYENNKVTHRNIAVASISVASASYLLMLFGNH